MQIETVQAYRTPDGKTFATEAEARQHAYRSRFIDRAVAYTEARGLKAANATRAQNIICDYLAYEQFSAQAPAEAA